MESPRPLLAIPHLLNQESACAYHGYLLALMAVEQTRAYFLKRDGYLTDNPRIGPDLAAHYWGPGNGMTHDETLQSLTGEGFSAVPLAEACNRVPPRRGNRHRRAWRRRGSARQGGTPSTPISGWCTGPSLSPTTASRGAHAGRLRGLDPAP